MSGRIPVDVTQNNYSKLFKNIKKYSITVDWKFLLKTHKFKNSKYHFPYLIKSWLLRGLCPLSMKSAHKVTGLIWTYSRGYLCPVHLTNQLSPVPWRAWLTTNDTLVCFLLVTTIGEQYSHWSICDTMSTLHSSFSCSSVYYQTSR